jgi:hypothetical protein
MPGCNGLLSASSFRHRKEGIDEVEEVRSAHVEGDGKTSVVPKRQCGESSADISGPWPFIHIWNEALLARVADTGRASGCSASLHFPLSMAVLKSGRRSTRSLFRVGRRFWRELAGANAASDLRRIVGWKGVLQLAVQLVFKVPPVGPLARHFFVCRGAISALGA